MRDFCQEITQEYLEFDVHDTGETCYFFGFQLPVV